VVSELIHWVEMRGISEIAVVEFFNDVLTRASKQLLVEGLLWGIKLIFKAIIEQLNFLKRLVHVDLTVLFLHKALDAFELVLQLPN
jgi:hypothetical protein